jgi:hypothetical protein
VLESIARSARERGDGTALVRIEREQFWIDMDAGLSLPPDGGYEARQLTFAFDE